MNLPGRYTGAVLLVILVLLAGCAEKGADGTAEYPPPGAGNLTVGSPAFADTATIPARHTCDGAGLSPPLFWSDIPSGTVSVTVLMDDPDAPSGLFTHWVVYNIPPATDGLAEGIPGDLRLDDGSLQGVNGFGRIGYDGPCPPAGPPHRYRFRVYALDTALALPGGEDRQAVEKAMEGHILSAGELTGIYGR